MKRLVFFFGIYLFFSVANYFSVHAQNLKELENRKKKTREEIEYANKLLNETRSDHKNSYNKWVIYNKKIKLRKELINNILREINLLNKNIEQNKATIHSLEKELNDLKNEYAKMIYYAYKNRNSYDKLTFILSSDDFNQAYRRIKYFQQYSAYREKQLEMIRETQTLLNNKNTELEQKIREKNNLLSNEKQETEILAGEKKEQEGRLAQLKKKEKELKEKIRKQENLAKQLQSSIEKLIAEETAKKKNFKLTPEEKALSGNFENNKGKLPWPTERGIITGSFGEHDHPVIPDIKIRNNGIDISTSEGAAARAVYEGVVSKVFTIPGSQKAVIIKHGDYYTVYSNLREVTVKPNQKVKIKQPIGIIFTDKNDDNKTSIHIEIWKQNQMLDPSLWLYIK